MAIDGMDRFEVLALTASIAPRANGDAPTSSDLEFVRF